MQSLRNLRTLRSLRHRNFRLLLEGALISSSGDFMQNVAQSWLVWHVSKSPVAIGVVAFFDTMPRLLIGALGGAIADAVDRRRMMQITELAFAAARRDRFVGTDEASLVERLGGLRIAAVRAERANPKLTYPEDLAEIERLLVGEDAR